MRGLLELSNFSKFLIGFHCHEILQILQIEPASVTNR